MMHMITDRDVVFLVRPNKEWERRPDACTTGTVQLAMVVWESISDEGLHIVWSLPPLPELPGSHNVVLRSVIINVVEYSLYPTCREHTNSVLRMT